MKITDNRLIEWAIKQAETNYKDDVSILLEHNFYSLEKDRDVRYVNTIISGAKNRIGLARTFIINGIGYDFNQVSWDSFERDAEAKGFFVTVLADANILYAKNDAERQRFLYLRAKLNANLANPVYMFERGLEWLHNAMDTYKTLLFEESFYKKQSASCVIMEYIATSIACYNQTYGRGFDRIEELKSMKNVPAGFHELCNKIIMSKSKNELESFIFELIKLTRIFFKSNDPRKKINNQAIDYKYLADWYQECSYYFRRIYHFCDNNDPYNALRESNTIHTDLDDIAKDLYTSDFNIHTDFNANDLSAFAVKVKKVENLIVSAIKSNNVKIDTYASVDDFIANN